MIFFNEIAKIKNTRNNFELLYPPFQNGELVGFQMNYTIDMMEPPTAVLTLDIKGLSKKDIDNFQKGDVCEFYLGYNTTLDLVLTGSIQVIENLGLHANEVRLYISSALDELKNKDVEFKYKNMTAREIIERSFTNAGYTMGKVELKKNPRFPRTKTIQGGLIRNMKKIIEKDCQSRLQINGKIVNIIADIETKEINFTLAPKNGLISEPIRNEEAISDDKKYDYEINSLFLSILVPGVVFSVDSMSLKARVKIESMTSSDFSNTYFVKVVK